MTTTLTSFSLPSPRHAGVKRTPAVSSCTVIVADHHAMARAGLVEMLRKLGGFEVIGQADDGRTAVRLVRETSPDLIILNVSLPLLNGIDTIRQIVSRDRDARILVCSVERRQIFVEESLRAGARGYLLQDSATPELAVAARAVLRGETYLSPKVAGAVVDKYIRGSDSAAQLMTLGSREREVLRLLSNGKSNKQIGSALKIGVQTVALHRTRLMEKLNLRNVAELTKYAIREGITTLSS